MKDNATWLKFVSLLTLPVLLFGGAPARAGQVNAVRTNLVDRWITNIIEVRVPVNRFISQFHTNWVDQFTTNRVEVFATNRLVKVLTNWVMVNVVRTNFIDGYQTNFKTLNLTNWNTVLVFKTNWVTKAITNVVELELAKNPSMTPEPRGVKEAGEAKGAPPGSRGTVLALQAKGKAQRNRNNQVEVQLSVHWTNGASAPLQVQQWRVEREDGTFLCFGQEQEFRRELPVGKYKVEVHAQRERDGQQLAALGTLAVSAQDVVLHQTTPARN